VTKVASLMLRMEERREGGCTSSVRIEDRTEGGKLSNAKLPPFSVVVMRTKRKKAPFLSTDTRRWQ
jgi:hypothetical protein